MNTFKPGDRVIRVKPYHAARQRFEEFDRLASGTVTDADDFPAGKNPEESRVPVLWDQWEHREKDSMNGVRWIDYDCLELEEITDEELAEVYKILGVTTKTEEV